MREALSRGAATWYGRLATALVVMVLGLAGYLAVNGRTPARWDLTTPLDTAIPFIPATLVLYHSYYVLPLVAALMSTPQDFLRMLKAAVPVTAVSFVTFLLFPAEMTRPTAESAGAWAGAFRWLYGIDGPANTFPSLHVAVTTLAWARARRWRNGWMWTLWGGAVILSKLTTKQHFVADVVAGSLVALAADAWAGRESRVLVPSGG